MCRKGRRRLRRKRQALCSRRYLGSQSRSGVPADGRSTPDYIGNDRMVLVQPSYYGTDNRLTIDTLKKLGRRARGVVMVEENVSERDLDAYHAAGVRAIRLDLFARASWPRKDLHDYITRMLE